MGEPATTWPAAVSERSAGLVHGPARRATVLAAFPTALYLQVGGHADVLPVVTRDGLRLPTSLAVATTLPVVGWGAQPGGTVVVGGGAVRLPGVTVRAVRTWRPHGAPRAASPGCMAPLAALSLPWRVPARALGEVLLGGEPTAYLLAERVAALVGAGPGLTPSGDDVLCGLLLALRLHPQGSDELAVRLWAAVQPRLTTTTSLSAALLREAAEGYAVEPVVRLLECLAVAEVAHDAAGARAAVQAVLTIGHTSGTDLLGGLAGGLDALSAPRVATSPTLTRPTLPSTRTARPTPRSLP